MPLQKRGKVTLEDDPGLQPEDPEELTLWHEYQGKLWHSKAKKKGLVQCIPDKPLDTEATKPLAIEDAKPFSSQADKPSTIQDAKPEYTEEDIIVQSPTEPVKDHTKEDSVKYEDLDVYRQAAIKVFQSKIPKVKATAKRKTGS